MAKNKTNLHHPIPKSRGGTNHYNNMVRVDEVYHANYHRFFGNDTFKESIYRILDMNGKPIERDFKAELLDVLESVEEREIYRQGTIHKRKIKPKK